MPKGLYFGKAEKCPIPLNEHKEALTQGIQPFSLVQALNCTSSDPGLTGSLAGLIGLGGLMCFPTQLAN